MTWASQAFLCSENWAKLLHFAQKPFHISYIQQIHTGKTDRSCLLTVMGAKEDVRWCVKSDAVCGWRRMDGLNKSRSSSIQRVSQKVAGSITRLPQLKVSLSRMLNPNWYKCRKALCRLEKQVRLAVCVPCEQTINTELLKLTQHT